MMQSEEIQGNPKSEARPNAVHDPDQEKEERPYRVYIYIDFYYFITNVNLVPFSFQLI